MECCQFTFDSHNVHSGSIFSQNLYQTTQSPIDRYYRLRDKFIPFGREVWGLNKASEYLRSSLPMHSPKFLNICIRHYTRKLMYMYSLIIHRSTVMLNITSFVAIIINERTSLMDFCGFCERVYGNHSCASRQYA